MKIPNTPFSTRLSGNAKETELRLRSIFQWKKKRPPVVMILLTALVVLLCFGLVSCEAPKEPEQEETLAVETTSSPESEDTAPEKNNAEATNTFDGQLRLIAEHVERWAVPAEYANERYAYCVTDLDGNGQLELIAANYGGTGHYTYSRFYQVNMDCTALVPCDYATNFPHDAQSEADIIDYTVDAYRSSNGLIWYIFDDYGKWGGAEYPEVKLSLHLSSEGLVDTIALAWKHSAFTEYGILDHTTCTDWLGTEWPDAESEGAQTLYDTAADRYFADCQKLSVTFDWLERTPEEIQRTDTDTLTQLLSDSWRGFTSTKVDDSVGDSETQISLITWQGESIAFPDGNLTIVPPESWAGKAAYQISENEVYFYLLSTSIETGYEGAGHLCTVKYLPGEFYPLNYSFPWPGETIAMTADGTYVYWTPSDVQFTPKTQEEYTALYSQVHEIQFVLSDWLVQNSVNAQNPDVPELTTAARKGLAMAVTEDTVMTNCYTYTYSDPADVSAYGWYRSGDDHRLTAGDVVLVLEEEDGMSRVIIPYGDIPRLYGFVDSDLLSGDKPDVYAAVGHVNQALIAYEIPGYAAPGGGTPVTTLVPCTVRWLEMQNGWAKVQPLVGGEDSYWVDSSHLYFGFGDEEVVDVPTGLNFFS